MELDEYGRSCRRQQQLIDRAQAAVLMAVDSARTAGHTTVTLDEHRTQTSRAAALAAHARADRAAQDAWEAVERLRTVGAGDGLHDDMSCTQS